MEIELEGFQLLSEGYAKLFSSSGDKWLCEKDKSHVNTYDVTLVMREDNSQDPISAWVYNPKEARITFKPGEKVKITCLCKWSIPAIYYIKRADQRKKLFSKVNMRRTYFVHGRLVSDPESHLQFTYLCGATIDECSVSVPHKSDEKASGKVRVYSWDLRFCINLHINMKNILKAEDVPYGVTVIYLEEMSGGRNVDHFNFAIAASAPLADPLTPLPAPRASISSAAPVPNSTQAQDASTRSRLTSASSVDSSASFTVIPASLVAGANAASDAASVASEADSVAASSVATWTFDESQTEHQLTRYVKKHPTSGDIKLIAADGTAVGTHRLLIEARSKLLEVEKVQMPPVTEIRVPVETKNVLEEFIHFLVHDSVRDIHSHCLNLFELACKYEVIPLRELCEKHFEILKVTGDSADRVSLLLRRYKSRSLLKAFTRYQSQRGEFKDIPTTIVEDLATAVDDFCDVTLQASDKRQVNCSSLLLLCRSKVLQKTLLHDIRWLPGQKATVVMPNFRGDVLEQFVHFLKTDTVRDMRAYALQLLLLADEYRIPKLAVDCINYITRNIQEFDQYDVIEVSQKVSSASKLAQAVQTTFE